MHIYQNNESNGFYWLVVDSHHTSTINMNICSHSKLFKWQRYYFQSLHCHFQCKGSSLHIFVKMNILSMVKEYADLHLYKDFGNGISVHIL